MTKVYSCAKGAVNLDKISVVKREGKKVLFYNDSNEAVFGFVETSEREAMKVIAQVTVTWGKPND